MKRVLTFGQQHQDAAIGTNKRLKAPIGDQPLSQENLRRRTNDEYTVGWICAIPTEYVAAQAILDEIHERPEKVSPTNQSDYTLGRIGKHNVVMATLPYGEYGTASAATVAGDMLHNFPNIKARLMVGIGGGAPNRRNDIRLGDIVVSAPSYDNGGVLQYDFGKTIQDQPFQPTRFLDQPPMILRTAMNGLIAQYEREGHRLEETVNTILERNPRLQKKYSRPHESSDRLYRSTFVHPPNRDLDCATSCGENSLVTRSKRSQEKSRLVIHYGLIASANQLMKDATLRDKLSLDYEILCFEMEAGGLMNHFPCLVIRGICDYSDSHKNKAWQGYAAMIAAAYAKDLINRISPTDSGVLQSTNDPSSGHPLSEENMPPTVRIEHISALLESLRFEQIEARQMTIKNAHAKTCRWLLRKPEYLDWLDATKIDGHGGFLWIRGKPGTGKSTLMNFACNNAKKTMRGKTVINFFFNARGEDLEKSTIGMYRSLLLQLLEKLPALQNIIEFPRLTARPGEKYHWNIEILTNLFGQAIQNLKGSSVVCFIDALDECEENEIRDMIKVLEHVGESTTTGSFRVCLSSRHYPTISISKGLNLNLEGQEGHSQDIISYINSELMIGSSVLANQIRAELQEKASGVFMWVVLVVSILNKEHDKGRIHILKKRLQEIPADLHALFRDILTRDHQDANELLLCIQWVLFTKQPLRPEQLYFALLSDVLYEWNPNEVTTSDMERFILNSSKGLTEITKSKSPTVQFIHESVRDYLLKENGLRDIWPDINANVSGDSHEQLKQCCLNYIAIGKRAYLKAYHLLTTAFGQEEKRRRQSAKSSFPFLDYAVRGLLHHANEAEASGINQAEFLKNFELEDWVYIDNLMVNFNKRRHSIPNLLYILAELNMAHLIRRCPDRLSFLKRPDGRERYGAPIFAALAMNSSESVRVFLDAYLEAKPSFRNIIDDYYSDGIEKNNLGRTFDFWSRYCFRDLIIKGATLSAAFYIVIKHVDVGGPDSPYRPYIHTAVEKGHESMLKLFLNMGADLDHQALLLAAISNGHEEIADFLLDNNAKIDGADSEGRTFLSIAAEKGLYSLVERSLNSGAEINVKFKGRSPLSYAAQSGSENTIRLLLDKGAELDAKDEVSRTPLSYAAQSGSAAAVKAFLERGEEIDYKDNNGRTPLSYAAQSGSEATVQLLLERGAELNARDNIGRTPLHYGAEGENSETVLEVLLHSGAEIDAEDHLGETPLFLAANCNKFAVVGLLLDRGADVNFQDSVGRTVLSHAVSRSNNGIMANLLLDRGAEVDTKDNNGRTPLSHAAECGCQAAARLLLESGAEIDVKDNVGRTPLSYTTSDNADASIAKILLERGANIDTKDNNGRTPLSYAASSFNLGTLDSIFKLLLKKGAEIDMKDNDGRTPLSHATTHVFNDYAIRRLLVSGADMNAQDNKGWTPLMYGERNGYGDAFGEWSRIKDM